MLDISLALSQLLNVTEIHIVAVENECKELLFLMKKECDKTQDIKITSVNIKKNNIKEIFSFNREDENITHLLYTILVYGSTVTHTHRHTHRINMQRQPGEPSLQSPFISTRPALATKCRHHAA